MNRAPLSSRRVVAGCALACASGGLATLSFAPFDRWWLIWFAFVPMIVAQYRVLPAAYSALGPALGIGGFMAGYFGGFFPDRAPWYMKALPLLFAGLILLTSRGERQRRERAGYAAWPLAAGASWVAVELLRSFVPDLSTWGFLGYALYRQAWLLQPVRLFGIFGLNLLIVLVNYALAMAVLCGLDRAAVFAAPVTVGMRQAARWCGGALTALAAWCALSYLMFDPVGPTVRVAVLQPGVRPRELGMAKAARDRVLLDRLSAQTREAAGRGARLIVWPEGALAADPALAYATELGALARATAATLVIGYGIYTPLGFRNEVATIDSRGNFVSRYGKDHPVGFLGETSISRGTYPTVDTEFGRMGSIICYDMDFTDTARRLARRGAQLIAVPSADWPQIAAKHYTHSVFRALETGAAVAKSEYSVDSAIVDGFGRIAASAVTPDGSAAVLVADVPLRSGMPLAARLGDWVGWLCVAGSLRLRLRRWLARGEQPPHRHARDELP